MLGFAPITPNSLWRAKWPIRRNRWPSSCSNWLTRAKPFAVKDLKELREFAVAQLGLQDLQAWDVGYASEKLRQQRYAFSEQEVKQYFPEDAGVSGLLGMLRDLVRSS